MTRPDNPAAQTILEKITDAQRAFILRMEPHGNDQAITRDDWDNINPCVESGEKLPERYWFGGLSLSWPNGQERITFRFNKTGLAVRALLARKGDGA